MALYERLLDEFGYNQPILREEIAYGSYSKPWINNELKKLCDEGLLIRFDKGVYYIPTQTVFGPSLLDPRKVIEKRYISATGNVYGYYGGQILMNQLGLSTQMPNVLEVYTNNEASRVRDIDVGRQKVRLRSSRVTVTADNVAVLSFLELMNNLSADSIDENGRKIIIQYIEQNRISSKDISGYAANFPDKVMRNLIESEVIYSVARE